MRMLRLSSGLFLAFLLIFQTTCLPEDAAAAVTVDRDDKGVWFISGPADEPLYNVFKAMGHAVATDRLWQMELYRRTATGRMAEVFGAGHLETDVFMRTLGYSATELNNAFTAMDPESQNVIQGYVDGINQRLAEIDANPLLLPFEFAVLGLAPEPWTVSQVLAWTAVMQRNFDPEALDTGQLDNAELLARLSADFDPATGFAMFNDLRWSNDPAAPSVIDHALPGGDYAKIDKAILNVDPRAAASEMKARKERILASLEKVNARVKWAATPGCCPATRPSPATPLSIPDRKWGFPCRPSCWKDRSAPAA